MKGRIQELSQFAAEAGHHYKYRPILLLPRILWLRLRHGQMLGEIRQMNLLARDPGELSPAIHLSTRHLTAWQRRINPPTLGARVDLKPRFYEACREAGLRVPETYFTGQPRDDLLLNLPTEFLVKPVHGGGGFGVSAYLREADSFRDTEGMLFTASALCRHLIATTQGRDLLFQEWIRPDPALSGITDLALPTIRAIVLSPRAPGGSRILVTMLRIPAAGRIVDNISFGEKGQQWVQLDPENGKALTAYRTHPTGFGLEPLQKVGPGAGVAIEDLHITGWSSIQTLVLNLAELFKDLGCLGFDIGLSSTGPVAIEGNTQWGLPPLPGVLPLMQETLRLKF